MDWKNPESISKKNPKQNKTHKKSKNKKYPPFKKTNLNPKSFKAVCLLYEYMHALNFFRLP